jgi:hypothetical protein
MYGATHFVNYDNSVFLAQGLLEKLAFRPESRACYERYIMTSLGQELAGNQCILLCSAEYQPGYYVNDFHFSVV